LDTVSSYTLIMILYDKDLRSRAHDVNLKNAGCASKSS
jgi:hypothetical protein